LFLGGPPDERRGERNVPAPALHGTSFQTAIFLLSGPPLRPSAGLLALAKYRPDGGNCRDQPDKSECGTDSLSLLYTEAVREK
jgi:hypothetical protein